MAETEIRPNQEAFNILPASGDIFTGIIANDARSHYMPPIPRVIPGSEIATYHSVAQEFGIDFSVKGKYVSENPLTKPNVVVEYGPFPPGVYSGYFERTVDVRKPIPVRT